MTFWCSRSFFAGKSSNCGGGFWRVSSIASFSLPFKRTRIFLLERILGKVRVRRSLISF